MFLHKLWPLFLAFAILIIQVIAIDPSPADRTKWDTACKSKAGPQFSMEFDAAGKPTGRCVAPPIIDCYWGPYTDPKTGAKGCCGKDNGTFNVDPVVKTEGACCVSPSVYSFDATYKKGGCCTSGTFYHVDNKTLTGSCCANSDDTYVCDCSCKPAPPPKCPDDEGKIMTVGGVEYKIFCTVGHSSAYPTLGFSTAKDLKECMQQCAAEPKCQGVNYWYGTTCVWATIYQFPPTTPAPGSGAFMCAIPTTKRP